MGSQVSPTIQILVLVKGDRQMGFQVSPTIHFQNDAFDFVLNSCIGYSKWIFQRYLEGIGL
jgi:hypothetical protein